MKIVFWNIKKGNLAKELSILAQEVQPDILFLAEVGMTIERILFSLNRTKTSYFFHSTPICEKVFTFSKLKSPLLRSVTAGRRFLVWEVNKPS